MSKINLDENTKLIKEKYFTDDESLETATDKLKRREMLVALGKKKMIVFDTVGSNYEKKEEIIYSAWSKVVFRVLSKGVIISFIKDGKKVDVHAPAYLSGVIERFIKENTELERVNKPMKWYNRIFGFRSQTPWKMVLSGLVYLMLFASCTSAFGDNETDVAKEPVEVVEADAEEIEEVNEPEEETEPEVVKEELYIKLDSINYDKENDLVKVVLDTNLPDETEVYVGLKEKDDEYYSGIVPNSSKAEDGKINVTLGEFEDDELGKEMIKNGDYVVSASYSVHDEHETNTHLLDEYGSFSELTEKYDVDGEIEETDFGYIVEGIPLGSFEITEAATEEDIEKHILEQKKKTAQTIDFKQLDKNADRHAGEYVTYTGKIIQIMEGDNITNIRLGTGERNRDILYIEYEGYTDFVEDDNVTIYGEIYGDYSYESQAGWTITVPGIVADIVE